MRENWQDYYEKALDEGLDMFEASQFADAAIRTDTADGIDHAEYILEDR